MRLYLDTNVYAHAQEQAQGMELAEWLAVGRHQVVLSEVHLAEAIAIHDEHTRNARLRLLAGLPSRQTRPLAYLQAGEFVNEVRRLRPQWRRLPVGGLAVVSALLDSQRRGWRMLAREPERLIELTGDYREVHEKSIRGSRAGQKTMRTDLLDGHTTVTELVLGGEHIPIRRLDFEDADEFCRAESCMTWYQALVLHVTTLSELRDYAEPYVDVRTIDTGEFAAFWIDEVDLDRLPRGLATSFVISSQRLSRIQHAKSLTPATPGTFPMPTSSSPRTRRSTGRWSRWPSACRQQRVHA